MFAVAYPCAIVCNTAAIMALEYGQIAGCGRRVDLLGQHGKFYELSITVYLNLPEGSESSDYSGSILTVNCRPGNTPGATGESIRKF